MIDIVLASKNQAKFVNQTIDGLLKQTYKNFRVICLDGYSNDGTEKFLKRIPNLDFHLTDSPVELCYLEGIELSESKYLNFATTSDFLIDESWLKSASNLLDKYPQIEIVWATGIHVSETGKYISNANNKLLKKFKNGFFGNLSNFLSYELYLPELCYVVRRNYLLKLINEKNLRDIIKQKNGRYQLWHYIILSFIKNKSKGIFIPKKVFAGRIHENSVTDNINKNRYLEIIKEIVRFHQDAVLIMLKRVFNNLKNRKISKYFFEDLFSLIRFTIMYLKISLSYAKKYILSNF